MIPSPATAVNAVDCSAKTVKGFFLTILAGSPLARAASVIPPPASSIDGNIPFSSAN